MALTLRLWSNLDSASDVTSPQVGIGGVVIGSPTFPAAKFNNGILSDANNEGCRFPAIANGLGIDKGTIEFWIKVKFASDDADSHWLFTFNDSGDGLYFIFSTITDKFELRVYQDSYRRVLLDSDDFTWNIDDLIHFGITWDREGNDIGGGKTVVLKINDVEKDSSVTTWDTGDIWDPIHIGFSKFGTLHSDAVIDDLKIYAEPVSVKGLVQACLI